MHSPDVHLLTPEQLAFLEEHEEVLRALIDITEQSDFKAVFDAMQPGEMVSRYINTLTYDANDAWEHDIGERYRQAKEAEAKGEPLVDWDADLDSLEAKYRK